MLKASWIAGILSSLVVTAIGCSPQNSTRRSGESSAHDQDATAGSPTVAGATSDASGASKEEDLSVEILVPMGLVNPEFIASVTKKLPTNVASLPSFPVTNNCDVLPPQILPPFLRVNFDDNCADVPFRTERLVVTRSTDQIISTRAALTKVHETLAKVFGEAGYFGTRDLKLLVGDGKPERKFKITKTDPKAAGPDFVTVSYVAGAEYPYVVDLYENLKDPLGLEPPVCALVGYLARAVHLEFARPDPASDHIKVRLQRYFVDPEFPLYCKYADIEYDTSRSAITYTEMWDHSTYAVRDKYVTTIEYLGDKAIITGANRWEGHSPSILAQITDDYSRMEYARRGDVDIFRTIARVADGAEQEAVTQVAFIPSEKKGELPAKPDAAIFTTHAYADLDLDYIVKLMRKPSFAPTCATGKADLISALRTQIGVNAIPQALKDAPDSFCESETKLTRAGLLKIVADVCLTPTPLINYGIGQNATYGSLQKLCEAHAAAQVIANPIFIEFKTVPDPSDASKSVTDRVQHFYTSSISELKTKTPPSPVYADLLASLKLATNFVDLPRLWSNEAFEVPRFRLDAFAAAEPIEVVKTP